jgi:hypothetical protein
VLVTLRLDDVIEATIDGGKAVVHFFAESADFAVKLANVCADFRDFSSDVLALLFDEARKLVELGLLLLWHAGQYTMSPDDAGRRAIRSGERGRGASDMQKSVVADRGLHGSGAIAFENAGQCRGARTAVPRREGGCVGARLVAGE